MTTAKGFDPQAFRAALGPCTTGVTVITTRAQDGKAIGIFTNSFNSVSLNPPLVLWSLPKNASSVAAFTNNQHWNVHILSTAQDLPASRADETADRLSAFELAGLELASGITKAPLLQDCSARFQCRTAFSYDGGEHLIFIGEVLAYDRSDLPPLQSSHAPDAAPLSDTEERIRSGAGSSPQCGYTEDLLSYLLGRNYYRMLHVLRQLLDSNALDVRSFLILSTLSIRGRLSIEEINRFIAYTGLPACPDSMTALEKRCLIASEKAGEELRYVLTADGREASLQHIALAKALDEQLVNKLGSSEVATLKRLLRLLVSKLDPDSPDLWSPH